MKVRLLAISLCALSLSMPVRADAPNKNQWTSSLRKDFDDSKLWIDLITHLREKHFHYGTVAAAERILQYFTDVQSKEFAYRTLVDSIDQGYPFSLSSDFIAGDIELTTADDFAQSYNFYKATSNIKKDMSKWAENYFSRIDKQTFPKYLFFQALGALRDKNPDEALRYLDLTLQQTKSPESAALATKAARTLARLLYENQRYAQSLDIYQNYLLKLNPIEPNDWIEASWALYRIGRHEEAVGMLFNLEAKTEDAASNPTIYLEPYIIRSLVYREKCDPVATASLNQTFYKNFGATLDGIKTGKTLKSLPLLKNIFIPNSDYVRAARVYKELELEKKRISELPSADRAIADYLLSSEMASLALQRSANEEDAWNETAKSLVILSESLKFIKFDVAREKYNPDKVFQVDEAPKASVVEEKADLSFEIHWIQWGDYWRDERGLYRSILKNRCE